MNNLSENPKGLKDGTLTIPQSVYLENTRRQIAEIAADNLVRTGVCKQADQTPLTPPSPLDLANRNEKERQDLIAHCVKTRDEAIAALKHMGHVDPPPVPEKRSYVRKQKTGVSA